MKRLTRAFLCASVGVWAGSEMLCAQTYSWRYYRPTNTGIQGDYCDALWIGPDDDPWIGGYVPSFEGGGLAKFVQSENRWINVSSVDYPEVGHPSKTGIARVRDITSDAQGNLWMGTGRGVLVFNPTIGPSSLKRYDASNSPWPGGWVTNIEIAPDGTIWASGYATAWGGGGLMRFNPATKVWTYLGSGRPERLAIQPKPGGGYYVWAAEGPGYTTPVQRYDSTTQSWTTIPSTSGNPRNLPGSQCVDAAGNMWIYRVLPDGFSTVLDCRRPDGTWVGVPAHPGGGASVTRAFGTLQAVTDGGSQLWRFNGTAWVGLGNWGNVAWTYDVAIDSAGAVWACGVGGAARRDPQTGQWQRYRVTNTSQYDFFNNDVAVDQATGRVAACANAGAGYGGVVVFDGTRWIGFNNAHYGLGHDWPFLTDNSESVGIRQSNGRIVVNPMYNGVREWDGDGFVTLQAGTTVKGFVEDSLGRLWYIGEYFNLQYYNGITWTQAGITGWGGHIQCDPERPGAVWAATQYEVTRTDGAYRFSRTVANFPELTTQSDYFSGLAAAPGGIVWIGSTVHLGIGGTGGALIRIDSSTGAYQMLRYDQGWPLPGKYVAPRAVTPDGRVWMAYAVDNQTPDGGGLCWYQPADATTGVFPGPLGGGPQWGGLPHAQIEALVVRLVPNGYELWMSCMSRGIAVLTVRHALPGDVNGDGHVDQSDLGMLLAAFGLCSGDLGFDPDADIDGDGCVGQGDLGILLANFGA